MADDPKDLPTSVSEEPGMKLLDSLAKIADAKAAEGAANSETAQYHREQLAKMQEEVNRNVWGNPNGPTLEQLHALGFPRPGDPPPLDLDAELERLCKEQQETLRTFMPTASVEARKDEAYSGYIIEWSAVLRDGSLLTRRQVLDRYLFWHVRHPKDAIERLEWIIAKQTRDFLLVLAAGPPYERDR